MSIRAEIKSPDEMRQDELDWKLTKALIKEIDVVVDSGGPYIETNTIVMGVFESIVEPSKRNHFLARLLRCLNSGYDIEDSLTIIAISNHYN